MKKYSYLIIIILISGLVLTGCLLSNVGQVPTTEQSGITNLTKGVPLSIDLVGLWRFNGDANDSSGNDNHGTVYGGEVYVNSPMVQALSFDGTSDYVGVAHADSLDVTSDYALEVWVNVTDDLLPNKYRPILFRGTTDANDIEVYVQAVSKDLIVAHNRGNGGTFDYVGFVDPPLGTPFHLAVTFDGTNVQAYYDGTAAGVSQLTTDMTAPLDTDKAWWIGKVDHFKFNYLESGDLHYFKGTIDEVRIWNIASPNQLGLVIYDFGGILPPIKADGSSVFKLGRTIPVKFQLRDDQGNFVTDALAEISLFKLSNGVDGTVWEDAVSTAAATSGNLFRYDSTSNQYIFNLATKGLSIGTWQIRIDLDDGMSYYVKIGLK